MNKGQTEKQRSQESVRKSREKKKRMLEEKQKEKDLMEEEMSQLSSELKYEENKKEFLNMVKDKNFDQLSFAEQETLRKYLYE